CSRISSGSLPFIASGALNSVSRQLKSLRAPPATIESADDRRFRRGNVQGAPRNSEAHLARSAFQPADADLRLHRLLLGLAALSPDQSRARVAALGAGRFEIDRALRVDPASVHVEVPVVAAPRSLCISGAGSPPWMDARHATLARRVDPRAGRARSVAKP